MKKQTKKSSATRKLAKSSTRSRARIAVAFAFVLVIAVVGTVTLRLSHADKKFDPVSSNQEAFRAIQADLASKGQKKINTSDIKLPESDRNSLATARSTKSKSGTSSVNYKKREAAIKWAAARVGYTGADFFDAKAFDSPFGSGVKEWAWCSSFVSRTLMKSDAAFWWGKYGGRPKGWQIPLVADVQNGMYFLGALRDKNAYTPQRGDIVFFTWSGGGLDHIGLIYDVDSTNIYTLEGNVRGNGTHRGNVVAKREHLRSSGSIVAYGQWFNN